MNDTNSPSRSECMHISPITSLQNLSNTDEVKKKCSKEDIYREIGDQFL